MNALYLLIALQALDLITTVIALQGKAVEANPILAKLFSKIGVLPSLLLVKGAFAFGLWYYQFDIHVYAVYALIAVYLWVVGNNLKVITDDNR